MKVTRIRWRWLMPVLTVLAIIAITGCGAPLTENSDGAGVVTEGSEPETGEESSPGRLSGKQSPKRESPAPKPQKMRYTLNPGPTIDGDFSAPHGTGGNIVCVALPFNEQTEVKVISVRFVSEVEGAFRYDPGAFFCGQPWQVDDQCEGSVLAPGTVCAFTIIGAGDTDSTARLTMALEQTCTGRSTPACALLPEEAQPSPAHPLQATWESALNFRYCSATQSVGTSLAPCAEPPGVDTPEPMPTESAGEG